MKKAWSSGRHRVTGRAGASTGGRKERDGRLGMSRQIGETYVPARGDVVWITLTPRAGREQSGPRPAVVLSPRAYNARVGLAVMVPVTSQAKGYPFEVPIPAGLPIAGAVLSDQVKSLDWRSRGAVLICPIPALVLAEILGKLRTLLD